MSKMMDQWLQKEKPGDNALTRPPASARVSAHKNEVRSIARGYFQNQFRVPAYKHVGRPTQDSQKRDEALDKVTNVFMEQYTLPTDTNELPNLTTRIDILFHRSYFHVWTMKGAHARFVTYQEHTTKWKNDTIPKWVSVTFYRWKKGEERGWD